MLLSWEDSIHIEFGIPGTTLTWTINMFELEQIIHVWYNFVEKGFRCWKMWFWNYLLQLDLQTIRDMWPFTRVCGIFEDHRYLGAQIVPVLFQ